MDTITHTVIGACLGEVLGGKKLGKKAMLWGAVGNNIPDIDVLSSLWLKQPDSLLAHRGFTHSILFAVLLTPLLAQFLNNIYKKHNYNFRDWIIIIGSGLFLHIFLDAFTSYGTGWFEPFSHDRISFNTFFIVDPFFSVSFLIASIALLILKRTSIYRIKWVNVGLVVGGAYLIFALVNKLCVKSIVEKSMSRQHISTENYFFTPTPFNNFLWYIVANDSSGYKIGYYSDFDKKNDIDFVYFSRNDSALTGIKDNQGVQKLIRFSQGYYIVENTSPLLVFNDLRFGQIGGWYDANAPFVFRYNLSKDAENSTVIQQGRMKAVTGESMKKLIERIKGI